MRITAWDEPDGTLLVTWSALANATQELRDGIEGYLAYVLAPKIGDVHPAAARVEVNLPKWLEG